MSRLVLFIFAGRRANMEVQKPYLDRIMADYPEAELHLWDLTRTAEDADYLRTRDQAFDGRVQVMRHLHPGHPVRCSYPKGYQGRRPRGFPPCTCLVHKPLFEKPYQWYAADTFDQNEPDTIYVKMDDDVLFLETDRFDHLIAPLAEYPNRIISANVINNAVCAKYQWDWEQTANQFAVGDPDLPKNDKRWWELHVKPEFAQWAHDRFLTQGAPLMLAAPKHSGNPVYHRTRPGEAVSINCIAFTHSTMRRLAQSFDHDPRVGDEGAVDRMLPWVCTTFHAAHLTFGPQDKGLAEAGLLDDYRDEYLRLSKEYLA